MFEKLTPQPGDVLLQMIAAFRADQRPGKIDLGVGVYRDAMGRTPVMRAVKTAEQRLLDTQTTKGYLGIEGDTEFLRRLAPIVFGELDLGPRLTGLQTPGGGGALWLGAQVIAAAAPGATVWVGAPTWINHQPIFRGAGLRIREHPFFDLATQTLRFDDMIESLSHATAGDVVLLHGCCHNPTGTGFDQDQWRRVAEVLVERRLVPFIDIAYQGLGAGLEEDAAGLRRILSIVDEAFVAYSCDKNFGMYRDRVGALFVASRNADEARLVESNALAAARISWSMPPDHGAAVVRTVLEDPELTAIWRAELAEMRDRVATNRAALAAADPALAFVAEQHGLFSSLPISREQARAVRANHAVYVTDSGRINLAGMQPSDADAIAGALRAEGFTRVTVGA